MKKVRRRNHCALIWGILFLLLLSPSSLLSQTSPQQKEKINFIYSVLSPD